MDAPHISGFVLRFFRRIVRGYFGRHFRAVRLSRASNLSGLQSDHLIVCGNHSSWWDPMVCVLLAETLMPARRHYAPMDAAALARYGILKRIGIFGVEMKTARGAAQFLRTGRTILEGGGVLWVTPQGRFADVRERPLSFKPGMAALAAKAQGGCAVVPLAIEYTFWDERLPEVLLHIGAPVPASAQPDDYEAALIDAMETLKTLAIARDASAFTLLREGRVGTGGFYQMGQRVWARVRGRRFQAAHTEALSGDERG